MNIAPLELNLDFDNALNLLEKTPGHYFITGRAGTGKSTLLQLFRLTTRKKIVVLAPTGVAALNVKGETIHSFFKFPPKFFTHSQIKKAQNARVIQALDVLVIDEISMVRADMIDHIDYALRLNRNKMHLPFGGVQLIFFGDLFQLPPVIANPEERQFLDLNYPSPFFFSAKALMFNTALQIVELRKIYRQEARNFIRLLDSVRLNTLDYDDLEEINERHIPDAIQNSLAITLSARNAVVDQINEKELRNLACEEYSYFAKITGGFDPRQYPIESALRLKMGAQVMFVKNDVNKEFVNGTIGKIVYLDPETIRVEIIDPKAAVKVIEVEKATWEILRYKLSADDAASLETEVLGAFEQYPLRLAWAITIHKSQGKTFDQVLIDLQGGAFEHGQTYVALSRCRTLEGVALRHKLTFRDVIVDERVIEFYNKNL